MITSLKIKPEAEDARMLKIRMSG